MGFRFRRSVKLLPGVRVNFSTTGASLSFGGKGFSHTIGHGRRRTTVGIPGTGVSYTTVHGIDAHQRRDPTTLVAAPERATAGKWLIALGVLLVVIVGGWITGNAPKTVGPATAVPAANSASPVSVSPTEAAPLRALPVAEEPALRALPAQTAFPRPPVEQPKRPLPVSNYREPTSSVPVQATAPPAQTPGLPAPRVPTGTSRHLTSSRPISSSYSRSSSGPKSVYVRGHYRKNGTYVPAHSRSRPRR